MSTVIRWLRALLLIAGLCVSSLSWADTSLENSLWRVQLDPATLAVRVTPAGGETVQASAGIAPHKVSQLSRRDNRIDWQWDGGAWTLSATLDQRDLSFSIKAREPAELEFLHQPASALGKALIWPLAEGHYVPRGDPVWQAFLLSQGEFNTTQDLSLPLWGVEHDGFSLHWLMTNPYNNRLLFSDQGKALALSARHRFTPLEPSTPMTFTLFLGAADPLAGAKRYRQWLIDNGRHESLNSKFEKTPEAKRLLGASHLYLWGNDLLGARDVRSWPLLLDTLRGGDALIRELKAGMDHEALQILASGTVLNGYQKKVLLRSLNHALNTLARKTWQARAVPDMQALASGYADVRAQVAASLGEALTPEPERWGSTLSLETIRQVQNAGLSRLWVGLGEGWEGGLWHPEAIKAGVAAGYLIAPYDSYETALSRNENPDWTTAHLGDKANLECAVVKSDGTLKSGFQQSGHYTDPRCVRPLLEQRVAAIRDAAGFNSWFLDAYATGMLFDSYRPGATMTQAQNAEGNIGASRWINEVLKLPTGSEDGNATTAQGVLFTHGMQTPVIGWGDVEMSKNPESRYFAGKWYPPEQPEVFFKPVPIKESLRRIHFDPASRLPLYQAVFHGSVITSHHWLFDSLKLTNVRADNELAQLLYNVAPLYHLSADTLAQRLPQIARQDAFFRPLHERLATQALTGFEWLSADRLVQQTSFEDGTRLLANFDIQAREVQGQTLPGRSLTVRSPASPPTRFQVEARP
ncbi:MULTISPECIES: glycoside hydrolase [Pseudomonas]|uniref:glycoside hydrolase n=1 Tax=Pseudomonas TaxID=286 RepID=UPI000A1D5E1E|nr:MULTISPECIES: glycoside hydrolase [Pseudomonas]MCX4218637.1 glycoside hydrolase [Pseudomonas sp. MCal1]UIN56733.1 glycoside hydrolase [Pseudomonas kribbensis]